MNALLITLIVVSINLTILNCYIIEPGPTVKATSGRVWPKPQQQNFSLNYYLVKPREFNFNIVGEECYILRDAIGRYLSIINNFTVGGTDTKGKKQQEKSWLKDKNFIGYLSVLDVILMEPCTDDELPTFTMQEQYELKITNDSSGGVLAATSIWGILRGLETFSQLLHVNRELQDQINCTSISDFPRYAHRGLLIDTSRHFMPMSKLSKIIDGMEYNKLNVFHWHITDDQSFPYESIKFPELSEQGAYLPSQVYSQIDIADVIRYGALRGVRVIVEFDTPGHTRCWGIARQELLTPCYTNGISNSKFGPMDPTKNFTYEFMEEFLNEIVDVFPDNYLHLGGDEVGYECWSSNPDIKEFMLANNITSYSELEGYYIKKLIDISDNLKMTSIVWEEVFTNVADIPKETLVQVWRDGWQATIAKVTKGGFRTLLSSCWYLDHLSTGGDWIKFYNCEPTNFEGNENQKKLIVGGEACMWSEVVNEYNLESRVWPRASATAEKLWSAKDADEVNAAQQRLEEHTCRMNRRGIQAQPPNGAGFCRL